jgi:hypothetical protein
MAVSQGGSVSLEDSTIAHAADIGVAADGATVSLLRTTFVTDTGGARERDSIHGMGQSAITLDTSAVIGARGIGLGVTGVGGALSLTGSLVSGTVSAAKIAHAIGVSDRATLTVNGSAVLGAEGTSILVGRDGFATIAASLVDGARSPSTSPPGAAAGVGIAVGEARCTLDRVLVRRADGAGVVFTKGGAIVKSSRLVDNAFGVLVGTRTDLLQVDDEPSDFLDGQILLFHDVLEGNGADVQSTDGS